MAYRDDRVAMLARADALERALDDAEAKRSRIEAERDALAAEASLLRAALVRAVGTRAARARASPTRARPELAAVLMLGMGFLLAALVAGRGRPSPTSPVAGIKPAAAVIAGPPASAAGAAGAARTAGAPDSPQCRPLVAPRASLP